MADNHQKPKGMLGRLMDRAWSTGSAAEQLAVKRDPKLTGDRDPADAARHMAAAAEISSRVGPLVTNTAGWAKELVHDRIAPGVIQDTHNNALGAQFGAALTEGQIRARMAETGLSFDDARSQLLAELANGWLRVPEQAGGPIQYGGTEDYRDDIANKLNEYGSAARGMLRRLMPERTFKTRPVQIDPPQSPFIAADRPRLDQRALDKMDRANEDSKFSVGMGYLLDSEWFRGLPPDEQERVLRDVEQDMVLRQLNAPRKPITM